MKILIIGTLVKDIIRHFDGTVSRSLGGLNYTIQALLSLTGAKDVILPLSYVGEDIYDEILETYRNCRQVRSDGFILTARPNNAVELIYTDSAERQERSCYPFPEIPFSVIEPFLEVDVILVNMISGWDIRLRTLVEIRNRFSGLISLDLHSLTLGRRDDGLRFPDNIEARGWIENCDIIQANEREFRAIGGDPENPELFFREICFKEDKIFNLTRSKYGSSSFYLQNGRLRRIDKTPPPEMKIVDPTGCGDAFMAAFIYDYFKNRAIEKAAKTANYRAAYTGTFRGLPALDYCNRNKGVK